MKWVGARVALIFLNFFGIKVITRNSANVKIKYINAEQALLLSVIDNYFPALGRNKY